MKEKIMEPVRCHREEHGVSPVTEKSMEPVMCDTEEHGVNNMQQNTVLSWSCVTAYVLNHRLLMVAKMVA